MVLLQMSVITVSKTDHMLLTSGSLNFYAVANKLLFYDGPLVRTFWVFERRELIYRKSISALIRLNKIALRSNASVIRQIIMYPSRYTYINTITKTFAHFCWLCPEVKNLTRSMGKGMLAPYGEFRFPLRVTKRCQCWQWGVPTSLPRCRRAGPCGCSHSRCWMLRLCKELQMLPLTHAGSFCSDRSGSQALCNVHCHILSASTVMSAEGKD